VALDKLHLIPGNRHFAATPHTAETLAVSEQATVRWTMK